MAHYMLTPIKTDEGAKAFIRALAKDDKLFHLDDSARSITRGDGSALFTPLEAEVVGMRQDEMFNLPGFDPHHWALRYGCSTVSEFVQRLQLGGEIGAHLSPCVLDLIPTNDGVEVVMDILEGVDGAMASIESKEKRGHVAERVSQLCLALAEELP